MTALLRSLCIIACYLRGSRFVFYAWVRDKGGCTVHSGLSGAAGLLDIYDILSLLEIIHENSFPRIMYRRVLKLRVLDELSRPCKLWVVAVRRPTVHRLQVQHHRGVNMHYPMAIPSLKL